MKRTIKRVCWSVLWVLVVLLLAIIFCGGPLIKHTLNAVGPKVLGVPVTLKAAHFSPFKGHLKLEGLHVGNPEGFKTDGMFDLGLLEVDLDTASPFTKVIVIHEVRIEGPEITYERALKNSNIGQLLEQLGPATNAPAPEKSTETTPKAEGGKKVVIQKLTMSGARVHATITALGGHALLLPLPPLSLMNIGGSGENAKGVTFVAAIRDILVSVFSSVTSAVTGAGGMAVDGVKAVGGAAVDGVKAVGTGADKVFDGAKSLIGLGDKKTDARK